MPYIYEWNTIDTVLLYDYFSKFEQIYLESSHCPNLMEIYKKCAPIISIELIDEDNHSEINKNCLFIWENNPHDHLVCTKIHCKNLYEIMYDNSIRQIQAGITTDVRVWKIKEENFKPELLVKYFDEEHYTVCIVDSNDHFLYALSRRDMKRELCFSEIPKRKELFIDDTCDNIENAAKTFLAFPEVESLPVLKNGRVVAFMLRRAPRKQVLQWDWIEEESITRIWNRGTRLLVSSLSDEIQGFVDRFSNLFQIDIFNGQSYQKYLSGKYTALLYTTDIWYNIMTNRYNIRQLYLDCLSDNMLTWFQKNHIEYYYFEMPKANEIYNFYKRNVNTDVISGYNVEINGCYFQRDAQREGFHVYGGRRFTVGEPVTAQNTIYVYGPCIAIGSFVTDADTIESYLQRHINNLDLGYKVVNCGGGDSPYQIGNDINSFYVMANTKFKPGDIVIHFGLCTWKNTRMHVTENYYRCAEAFNSEDVLDTKCFSQYSAAHVNALGNSILERYIFSKIENSLHKEDRADTGYVSYGKNKKQIDNDQLNQWIRDLEQYKTNYPKIGCIVMNCNPFTKGHYYLVEQARAKVDYLYVFIVEEDKSFFSFKERYEMALKNCAHWQNVKVIPSGGYIISGLTFEEYFNKDELQEQTIFPEMDIQMFVNYVAPTLNITVRFFGEETHDMITAQYNKAMRELLPLAGIEVVEFPRYAVNGEIISASTVRKCIADKNLEELKKYLPEESLQYILKNKDIAQPN